VFLASELLDVKQDDFLLLTQLLDDDVYLASDLVVRHKARCD
jgi:hypothetical protein